VSKRQLIQEDESRITSEVQRNVGRKWLICIVLVSSFALLPGIWIARNTALTGVPVVSTIEGYNLLHFRAAAALAFDRNITLAAAQADLEGQITAIRGGGAFQKRVELSDQDPLCNTREGRWFRPVRANAVAVGTREG
jgi:hypothetical protein